MEEQPRKRLGRPRKVLGVPNAIAEGESASSLDSGDGETSGTRTPAPSVGVRQSEGWDQFVVRVIVLHERTNFEVRQVWTDNPQESIIVHHNGSIVVSEGQELAILKSGEFVEI